MLQQQQQQLVTVGLLPQQEFPPGWLAFGSRRWLKNHFKSIAIVHNNQARLLSTKLKMFKEYYMWFAGPLHSMHADITEEEAQQIADEVKKEDEKISRQVIDGEGGR
eukprot:TRINITY_DN4366_c0_g1_i1.p1 TRINITY_DN4366_c0_g1~~TRINITY_DN4366_c0_g1_i1.p1  ORF type:complete len:107 (+),score=47.95 TRINITY_DN4366_c0_g1_i1:293-613(+)